MICDILIKFINLNLLCKSKQLKIFNNKSNNKSKNKTNKKK